ncbi:MAG: hypothetical protein HY294_03590 [Candidatus Rokubacteria bacterium]|nr:hypothetical protein [Candidatus Rokubacteria bacterium]MBI3825058.1 hypothetical protein [Candidatus Rokubacteria bacterium]
MTRARVSCGLLAAALLAVAGCATGAGLGGATADDRAWTIVKACAAKYPQLEVKRIWANGRVDYDYNTPDSNRGMTDCLRAAQEAGGPALTPNGSRVGR